MIRFYCTVCGIVYFIGYCITINAKASSYLYIVSRHLKHFSIFTINFPTAKAISFGSCIGGNCYIFPDSVCFCLRQRANTIWYVSCIFILYTITFPVIIQFNNQFSVTCNCSVFRHCQSSIILKTVVCVIFRRKCGLLSSYS